MRNNPAVKHLLGDLVWFEDVFDRERAKKPWEVDLVMDNPEETCWPSI